MTASSSSGSNQAIPAQKQQQDQQQRQAPAEAVVESPVKMLPIRMTSTVVRGFGRGSKDLGIPTANLDLSQLQMHRVVDVDNNTSQVLSSLQDIPCGIYWGYCRVGDAARGPATPQSDRSDDPESSSPSSTLGVLYKTAISIGYNPTYGNDHKTVEPHLIATETDPRRHASCSGETVLQDFYQQPIRLSVVGYLRPELPFEGLDKLVVAIKKDISDTVELAKSGELIPAAEIGWVESNEELAPV